MFQQQTDILSADDIFERIVVDADSEFSRSTRLLLLSGIAGGLNISLSFLAQSMLIAKSGDTVTGLVASLAYPLGFIFVVLGRYQLFTENTLSPVALVLARQASIPRLLRIWSLVYVANLLGTGLAAALFAQGHLMNGEVHQAAIELVHHSSHPDSSSLFAKGIAAGWIVAGMVWLAHAARSVIARIVVIFITMYTVSVVDLAHCVVGSCEHFYAVLVGELTLYETFVEYLLPVTLGNTLGGVVLVAILNFAQTRSSENQSDARQQLSVRELLFGERR